MADAMKKLFLRTTTVWEKYQIELHGQYSVERLFKMKTYAEQTSWGRLALVYCMSVVPCLVVNIGLECIPLRPISEGLAGSTTFFIRSAIVLHFMGFLAFQHYRQLIPELPSSVKQICVMTLVLAMGTLLNEYLFARWIGHPVPFLVIVVAPTYMSLLLLNIGVAWGKFLRSNKDVFWELVNLQIVLTFVFSLAFAYPVYNYFFVRIPPAYQLWFTMLLPVIKILAKNASATSLRSTMLLMLMDVVHAWLSLRDITLMMDEIDATRAKLTAKRQQQGDTDEQDKALADLPAHVLFLVKASPKLFEVSRMVVLKGLEEIEQPALLFDLSRLETRFPEAEQKLLLQTLDVKARSKYVASVLKLLHMVEFLVLVEFTEVIIPFVYSVYLYATFLLPNHLYHTQLRDAEASELRRTLGNVMIYASLELFSFVFFQVLIYRKIRISPAHQLAFVLEKQWTLVQLKLCVWFLFIIQFSVDHFGNDYSFTFAWLKQSDP